ncbi:HTH domain-containing protein [Microbacterium sp. TPD7012]|uniref:HTH domain-containing protein n=1 Tax=Microbacterium sp. TPD7012 TaxID=2171975 RepID=UPI000D51E00B|nr:HTH domain-containing protein [Microbacterium sp. TPD7012]PVE94209.1 hypothetical protein DC434_15830 [Microbacterium sp. TPD7012]
MTTNEQDISAELRRLIAMEHISEDSLHSLTQISRGKLQAFLREDSPSYRGLTVDEQPLSPDENGRIAVLVAQLTYGLDLDDDERLRAIMESLTTECNLTVHNIANLTGLDVGDLEICLNAPRSLPAETKYAIALRTSYLISAATQARAR